MHKFKEGIVLFTASLAGLGYLPFLEGTWASLAGVFFFFSLKDRNIFFIFSLILSSLAFLVSGRAERILKEKDAKKIVIDDFSGMLVALLYLPHDFVFVGLAFFLFRALDALKVPPSDIIEKKAGAIGVVGDDLCAGIYTNIILQALRLILKISS